MFFVKLFLISFLLSSIQCNGYSPEGADSSQLDIQTTEESKQLNIEKKNGLTSGQPSNYRKTKRIAKRMAIKTISDLKANSSPNSPKDSGAFIWIGFAVVFVILVVIALIWALKSFCEIKQNESIEYKRIRVLASYLDSQDMRNREQTNITGVVPQEDKSSVAPKETKQQSIRSEVSGESLNTKNETKPEKSGNTSYVKPNQLKSDQPLPNVKSKEAVPTPSATNSTQLNTTSS